MVSELGMELASAPLTAQACFYCDSPVDWQENYVLSRLVQYVGYGNPVGSIRVFHKSCFAKFVEVGKESDWCVDCEVCWCREVKGLRPEDVLSMAER